MKRIAIILLLVFSFIIQPQATHSAPGDSIAEATSVTYGDYTGTLLHETDIDWYNFTVPGNYYVRQVITLNHQTGQLMGIGMHDKHGNVLAFHAGLGNSKSTSASGYKDYIISIEASSSSFSTFPAQYSFTVHLDTTLMPIGKATAKVGNNQGYLDPFDTSEAEDRRIEKWYNFTGSSSHDYTFGLSSSNNTFLSIEIFDSNLNFLGSDYGVGTELSIELSGYDKYVIVIGGNDTTTHPVRFTLNIKDNPPPNYDLLWYSFAILVVVLGLIWIAIRKGLIQDNTELDE